MFSDIKKNQNHIPFSKRVVDVLHNDFNYSEISEEQSNILPCLLKYDALFHDLESIGINNEMYELHRALHKTQEALHEVSFDLIKKRLVPQLDILRKRISNASSESLHIERDIAEIWEIEKIKEKVMERNARVFKTLSYAVSVIDIIISVVLIVLISKIAHVGEKFLNSPLMITLFIVVVALIKVLFDRYVVIPQVHRMGWKQFRERVEKVEHNTSILASIILLITLANKEQKSVEDIVKLLDKGIRLMKEKI